MHSLRPKFWLPSQRKTRHSQDNSCAANSRANATTRLAPCPNDDEWFVRLFFCFSLVSITTRTGLTKLFPFAKGRGSFSREVSRGVSCDVFRIISESEDPMVPSTGALTSGLQPSNSETMQLSNYTFCTCLNAVTHGGTLVRTVYTTMRHMSNRAKIKPVHDRMFCMLDMQLLGDAIEFACVYCFSSGPYNILPNGTDDGRVCSDQHNHHQNCCYRCSSASWLRLGLKMNTFISGPCQE